MGHCRASVHQLVRLNLDPQFPHRDPEDVARRTTEGSIHLKCVANVYAFQMRTGNDFLHKHPRGSKSWDTPHMRYLLKRPDKHVVRCVPRQFGATHSIGQAWSDSAGKVPRD